MSHRSEPDPFSPPLRILLLDDSKDDLEINIRALRALGRPVLTEAVTDQKSYCDAIIRFRPDIILSDYAMPGFSGEAALEIAKALAPDAALIYVSGTIGEELAIEVTHRGAADYVLKDNLLRLAPAIERALILMDEQREKARMQNALHESEERFRTIVESTEDWIWERTRSGQCVYSNRSVFALLGVQPDELIGKESLRFMVDEDREMVLAKLPELISAKKGWSNWLLHWRHQNGGIRVLESNAQPVFNQDGWLMGYRGIDRDITVWMQQSRRIEQQARMQAMLSAHGNAVLRARDSDELLDVTCRIAVEQGHFKAAVIGKHMPDNTLHLFSSFGDLDVIGMVAAMSPIFLDDPETDTRLPVMAFRQRKRAIMPDYAQSSAPEAMRNAMAGVGIAAHIALPIGDPPWAVLSLLSGTPQEFDSEETLLLERLTSEIDYARNFIAKSERLEYLAYHHPVTGFPNRARFDESITGMIANGPHVVVMVGVDRFRNFSSSRGHAFGEELLVAVGSRLRLLVPEDALFAHPGDDAFLFAYPADETMDAAVLHIEKILNACSGHPFMIEGEQVNIRLHASVLLAPIQGDRPDAIERSLVAVLAEAQHRDEAVHAFTEDIRQRVSLRADLERDLRTALGMGAFELFLQPKFETASQRLTGAEALLRWRHPERGLVSPALFIPLLEETGLIIDVGNWVRHEGLAIWRKWHEQGHTGLRIAVNVSARELRHVDFVGGCKQLLDAFNGEHGLDIEITESMLMDDINKSIDVLQTLRELGCKLAIDDFGTGYSSLNYLSRLPVHTLKIDQSFTAVLAESPDTLSLITTVISMAHLLSLTVIAEGVETEEQLKLLRLLRCDELQGYFLGRPVPVAEFENKYLS